MTNCPKCQSAGNGLCVCGAGRLQGQAMAAANQRAGQAAQFNQMANGQLAAANALAGQAALAQQAASMLDPAKTREMLDRLATVQNAGSGLREAGRVNQARESERRLLSLAREAIRCAVESVVRTRRSDGNRVDTKVLERALEALDEFRAACDPLTLLSVLDGEDE